MQILNLDRLVVSSGSYWNVYDITFFDGYLYGIFTDSDIQNFIIGRSDDFGETWEQVDDTLIGLALCAVGSTLYVLTTTGVYTTTNGTVYNNISAQTPNYPFYYSEVDQAFHAMNFNIAFPGGSDKNPVKSVDGVTWVKTEIESSFQVNGYIDFDGYLYMFPNAWYDGAKNNAAVYRSLNGTDWSRVFNIKFGTTENAWGTSLGVFKDEIYFGCKANYGSGWDYSRLYRSLNGTDWNLAKEFIPPEPDPYSSSADIRGLMVLGNYLYADFNNAYGLQRSADGDRWERQANGYLGFDALRFTKDIATNKLFYSGFSYPVR